MLQVAQLMHSSGAAATPGLLLNNYCTRYAVKVGAHAQTCTTACACMQHAFLRTHTRAPLDNCYTRDAVQGGTHAQACTSVCACAQRTYMYTRTGVSSEQLLHPLGSEGACSCTNMHNFVGRHATRICAYTPQESF